MQGCSLVLRSPHLRKAPDAGAHLANGVAQVLSPVQEVEPLPMTSPTIDDGSSLSAFMSFSPYDAVGASAFGCSTLMDATGDHIGFGALVDSPIQSLPFHHQQLESTPPTAEEEEEEEDDDEAARLSFDDSPGKLSGSVDRQLLCKQYKLCSEPRVPKSRGKGLHPYCAKHKEVRQEAWRKAAKRYREKKRSETAHQEGYEDFGDDYEDEENIHEGYTVASSLMPVISDDNSSVQYSVTSSGSSENNVRGSARRRKLPPQQQDQHQQYNQQGASPPASYSRKGNNDHTCQPQYDHHAVDSRSQGGLQNTTMPWPQLWFQRDMMSFVEPSIRQAIKRDFDNFTQGKPGFKGCTVQSAFSMEINASPAHCRKSIAAIMGKRMLPIDKLSWFDPFLHFLAEQWWDTAMAMFIQQIEKDETAEERQRAESLLRRATTTQKRKDVLISLLSSMTMLSYSTGQDEVLLGPKYAHMIMVVNIHGDGDLSFRLRGTDKLVTFPFAAGDVFCYTGDYRYESTQKVALQSDYGCTITLRFYLPGRELLVRMRGMAGDWLGWRKLDKKDKEDDGIWGPVPGKRGGGQAHPNLKALTAVLQDDDGKETQQQSRHHAEAQVETAEQAMEGGRSGEESSLDHRYHPQPEQPPHQSRGQQQQDNNIYGYQSAGQDDHNYQYPHQQQQHVVNAEAPQHMVQHPFRDQSRMEPQQGTMVTMTSAGGGAGLLHPCSDQQDVQQEENVASQSSPPGLHYFDHRHHYQSQGGDVEYGVAAPSLCGLSGWPRWQKGRAEQPQHTKGLSATFPVPRDLERMAAGFIGTGGGL